MIEILADSNALAGTGNVFEGSFGGSFCDDPTAFQTGAIGFSATSSPGGPATCPPAFP